MDLENELCDLLDRRSRLFASRHIDALRRDAATHYGEPIESGHDQIRIEDFELPNAVGMPVRLSSLLERGPLALLLFRGCWSERDRFRLQALESVAPNISSFGGTCAALSPLVPVRCLTAADNARVSLEMISDVGAIVSRRLSKTWVVRSPALWALRRLGIDVPRVYGLERPSLPTPCLVAIGHGARVLYRHAFSPRGPVDDVVFRSLIQRMAER